MSLTSIATATAAINPPEVEALSADLRAVVKKHAGDRDASRHPQGTRRVFCLFAIVPEA